MAKSDRKNRGIKVSFKRGKETKGTWVYEEDAEEGEEFGIPTLYIRKTAIDKLGGSFPDKLTITIE